MKLTKALLRTAGCLLAVSFGLLGLPGPLAAVPTVRAVEKPFIVVTTSSDLPVEPTSCSPNPDSPDVTCKTLRAALQYVNTLNLKYYQVVFAEALQDQVIQLDGDLGGLQLTTACGSAASCLLDGGAWNVQIDGSQLAPGVPILQVGGSRNVVRGLTFTHSNGDGLQVGMGDGEYQGSAAQIEDDVFLGNAGAGVSVRAGGSDTTIANSLFGLVQDPSPGVCGPESNRTGIEVLGPVTGVQILANTVGCSREAGVSVRVAGSSVPFKTMIAGNAIGVDRAGKALGNAGAGLEDRGEQTYILNNVISGNGSDGVRVEAAGSTLILGNRIGTDPSGQSAVPNAGDGIAVLSDAVGIRIGGVLAGDRNIISGNLGYGVSVQAPATVQIKGNTIGVGASGDAALPNGLSGILVDRAVGTLIGSDEAAAPQVISANRRQGILLRGASGALIGSSNRVGLGLAGSQPLGNGLEGVLLEEGTVGTVLDGAVVAYNGRAGIAVAAGNEAPNDLRPGQVYQNGGLPIDLGSDGPTRNAPGPGGYLGYPTLLGSSGTQLWGSTCPGCRVEIYRALGDPGMPGGGGERLASALADHTGAWSIQLSVAGEVALLAVEPGSPPRSSELSPRPLLYLPFITSN